MKREISRISRLLFVALCGLLPFSCDADDDEGGAGADGAAVKTFTANGVSFNMVKVEGPFRVCRGGWLDKAKNCRLSRRSGATPDYRMKGIGLRLAL